MHGSDDRQEANGAARDGEETGQSPFLAGRSRFDDVPSLTQRMRQLELHAGLDYYGRDGAHLQEKDVTDSEKYQEEDHGRKEKSDQKLKKNEELEEPWMLPQFQGRPRRATKDEWIRNYEERGWLIREHRKDRKRLFHPVHSSLPVPVDYLKTDRVTLMVGPKNGLKRVQKDVWSTARRGNETEPWRGWTFFRVKQDGDQPASSSQRTVDRAHLEESDGSYEVISGSEQPWA